MAQSLIAQRVLQLGPTYLSEKGYEVVDSFTDDAKVIPASTVDWKAVAAGERTVYVRQKPGPANSLGQYKFYLPNGKGIYLHDTPNKGVFAQDKRDLSHGCVRLEDAPRLARWLLGKDPPASTVPEEHVLLPQPVPITISYLDPMSQTRLASLQ
jgi:murein L,D-transpeptidase YcbB/YkuD